MSDLKREFAESVREADDSIARTRKPRPAPQLPEGYRVEDHGNGGETLWTPQGHPLMVWSMDGSVEGWYSASFTTDVTEEAAEHTQALAIWLQRQVAKPPETGTQTSKESK